MGEGTSKPGRRLPHPAPDPAGYARARGPWHRHPAVRRARRSSRGWRSGSVADAFPGRWWGVRPDVTGAGASLDRGGPCYPPRVGPGRRAADGGSGGRDHRQVQLPPDTVAVLLGIARHEHAASLLLNTAETI